MWKKNVYPKGANEQPGDIQLQFPPLHFVPDLFSYNAAMTLPLTAICVTNSLPSNKPLIVSWMCLATWKSSYKIDTIKL